MWADVLSTSEMVMFDEDSPVFKSLLLKSRVPAEHRMNAMLKHETADNAVAVSTVQVEICHERLLQLQKIKDELPNRVKQTAGVDVAEQRIAQAQATLARLEARREELKVKSIYIDKATSLKRFTARAKGRGNRIEKQTCHITVTLGN